MKLKTLSFCIFTLVFSTASVAAIDSTKQAKILELMSVTKADEMLRKENLRTVTLANPTMSKGTAQDQEKMRQHVDRLLNNIDYEDLRISVAEVYDANYSLEEVDGMLAFYKSPVGQKVVTRGMQVVIDTQSTVSRVINEAGKNMTQNKGASKKSLKKIRSDKTRTGYNRPELKFIRLMKH